MTKYNERPLYLMMDHNPRANPKELPVFIFEEEMHVVDDKSTTVTEFVQTTFKLQADEVGISMSYYYFFL